MMNIAQELSRIAKTIIDIDSVPVTKEKMNWKELEQMAQSAENVLRKKFPKKRFTFKKVYENKNSMKDIYIKSYIDIISEGKVYSTVEETWINRNMQNYWVSFSYDGKGVREFFSNLPRPTEIEAVFNQAKKQFDHMG